MILENNEEKRSTLWRTIVAISSILIVIVAVFFVTRLFVGNPLVGTWVSEDSGEVIKIESNGKVTLTDEVKSLLRRCNQKWIQKRRFLRFTLRIHRRKDFSQEHMITV